MTQFVKLNEDIPCGIANKIAPFREETNNIFNCGLTNYYENPTTDLIAFFIEQSAKTDKNLFFKNVIKNLLNKAGVHNFEAQTSRDYFCSVDTQITTSNGNRIDLVLETTSCVFVIEAKIYHEINNPLDDYERYCKKLYKNKSVYCYILTRETTPPQNGWNNITYSELVATDEILPPNSKLDFYLEDFIKHLHLLCGANDMDNSEIQYVIENSNAITLLFTSFYRINEQIRNSLNNSSIMESDYYKFFLETKDWGSLSGTGAKRSRIEKKIIINSVETRFVIYPKYFDSNKDKGITIYYDFWTLNNEIKDQVEERLRVNYNRIDSSEKNFLIIRKVDYSGKDFVSEVCKDAISILENLTNIQNELNKR